MQEHTHTNTHEHTDTHRWMCTYINTQFSARYFCNQIEEREKSKKREITLPPPPTAWP